MYQDTDSFIPAADPKALEGQIQELMCYIWDNYLQLYDNAEKIILMGVGNAYLGVKVLLINRGEKISHAGPELLLNHFTRCQIQNHGRRQLRERKPTTCQVRC
jgi:hypothetical protein